ncbi:MAG: glycosyltransferase family 39 protein, partial [Elusimicrobiota bacterium]
MTRRAERLAAALLTAFFLFTTTAHLKSPGFIADGLDHESRSVELLDSLAERPLREVLFGSLPLSTKASYHGTSLSYLYLPLFALFGPSWLLMRLLPVLLAFATLVLTYGLVRKILGRGTALLALLLLALDPNFAIAARMGSVYQTPLLLFSVGCLYSLQRFWVTRREVYFVLAVLLAGIGLCAYLWFAWFVAALVLAAVVFRKELARRFSLHHPNRRRRLILLGAAALLPALILTFAREASTGFDSLNRLLPALRCAHPALYVRNLAENLRVLHVTLNGSYFLAHFFGAYGNGPSVWTSGLYPGTLWASVALCLCLAVSRKGRAPRKAVRLVLVLFLGMLAQTPFIPTHSMFDVLHAVFLDPFPQILLAAAGVHGGAVFKRVPAA